jgi:flagellar biosynthesis/type III secretory pathway protein FliH
VEDPEAAAEAARRAEREAWEASVRRQAREDARAETAERFEEALRELAAERERLVVHQQETAARMEPHVVELALAIARRLVAEEIEEGRLDIRPVVETVLRELREPDSPAVVEVALDPDDYAVLACGTSSVDGVRIVADQTVPRGAVVVKTDAGRIWSDLDARVRTIRRALRDVTEVAS